MSVMQAGKEGTSKSICLGRWMLAIAPEDSAAAASSSHTLLSTNASATNTGGSKLRIRSLHTEMPPPPVYARRLMMQQVHRRRKGDGRTRGTAGQLRGSPRRGVPHTELGRGPGKRRRREGPQQPGLQQGRRARGVREVAGGVAAPGNEAKEYVLGVCMY